MVGVDVEEGLVEVEIEEEMVVIDVEEGLLEVKQEVEMISDILEELVVALHFFWLIVKTALFLLASLLLPPVPRSFYHTPE